MSIALADLELAGCRLPFTLGVLRAMECSGFTQRPDPSETDRSRPGLSRPPRLGWHRAFLIGVAGGKGVYARLRRAMPGDDALIDPN
jgi:hypothetical protein